MSVTIATDDARIGIVTETAPATDTASSGLNGRLQRIAQRLTSLIAQIPASLGIKTAANSMSITMASDDALLTVAGTTADAAWVSGNGTFDALLKAIAAAAISTNPVQIFRSDSFLNITTKTTTTTAMTTRSDYAITLSKPRCHLDPKTCPGIASSRLS